jgi:superoxide dismutase
VKADYVNAVWDLVNWPDVIARWTAAAHDANNTVLRVA